MTIAATFEFPTGDTNRQLGSGLADVYFNGILQKSVSKETKLRLNVGILFSGNQTTGAVRSRGTVVTSGGSLVKQINQKLQLGMELTRALENNFQVGKGQLQTLLGGKLPIQEQRFFRFWSSWWELCCEPSCGCATRNFN